LDRQENVRVESLDVGVVEVIVGIVVSSSVEGFSLVFEGIIILVLLMRAGDGGVVWILEGADVHDARWTIVSTLKR
jgi:hypothetical protein